MSYITRKKIRFISHLLKVGCDIGIQLSVCTSAVYVESSFKVCFPTPGIAVSGKACIVIVLDILPKDPKIHFKMWWLNFCMIFIFF